MTSTIDPDVTKAQFADFPTEIGARLLSAAQSDITSWSDQLLAAWEADDRDAVSRARHALKGLCGNFGATSLLAMAQEDLSLPTARVAFQSLREATLQDIRLVALSVSAS